MAGYGPPMDSMLSPGREVSGVNLGRKAGPTGAMFSGDLTQVGTPGMGDEAAIERVMANVADKGSAGMITPEEFYKLLSAKFSKGDSEKEMEDVFDRMGAKPGLKGAPAGATQEPEKELGIEELYKVAQMLGESSMTKPEIKDMIKCFKRLAKASLDPAGTEEDKKKRTKPPKVRASEHYTAEDEKDPMNVLNLREFIAIMNLEL